MTPFKQSTISKIADNFRGTPKPFSATSKGWREWQETAQNKHPIRYWIVEDAIPFVADIVFYNPRSYYRNTKSYFYQRFISKSNSLVAHKSDIKPGDWADLSDKLLLCSFNAFRDFVEVESAWKQTGRFRRSWFSQNRDPEAGVAYYTEISNGSWSNMSVYDDTVGEYRDENAQLAKEILELYNWWVNVYPARKDPYDDIEIDHSETMSMFETGIDNVEIQEAFKKANDIDTAHRAEDDAMLARLIKIRHRLWS